MMNKRVNGPLKTTAVGKLAYRLLGEELESGSMRRQYLPCRGRRAIVENHRPHPPDVKLIRQKTGADPGAVKIDALQAVKAQGMDYVIVNTAGPLHSKEKF